MKDNLVFFSKNNYGHLNKDNIEKYDDFSLNNKLLRLQNEIIKKDNNRKIFSFGILVFVIISLIVLAILSLCKVLNISLFLYTFIVALATLLWVILYYIFGIIFYNKITLDIYFKNLKSTNPLSCYHYKSTNYAKYLEKISKSFGKFTLYADANHKKLIVCSLKNKNKIKNHIIFNGLINSNIPYFYIAYQNKRILFFPGIIIYINKKDSKVILANRFSYLEDNLKCTIFIDNKEILTFYMDGIFDINMFNFNY